MVGGDAYDIEVKLAHRSEADADDEVLSDRLRRDVPIMASRHLQLLGNRRLEELILSTEGRRSVRSEFDGIVAAYQHAAEAIREKSGAEPGRYDVPEYGAIEVTLEQGHGSITAQVLAEPPARKKAARVARLVRQKAMPQLNGGRPGLVVVGVDRQADLALIKDELLKGHSTGIDYRRCRGVIFVDYAKLPGSGGQDAIPVAYPASTSRIFGLSRAELKLASTMAGGVRQPAKLVKRTAPGQRGFILSSQRSVTTTQSRPRRLAAAVPQGAGSWARSALLSGRASVQCGGCDA